MISSCNCFVFEDAGFLDRFQSKNSRVKYSEVVWIAVFFSRRLSLCVSVWVFFFVLVVVSVFFFLSELGFSALSTIPEDRCFDTSDCNRESGIPQFGPDDFPLFSLELQSER